MSILLLVGLLAPAITNAQTCPPAQVMTGTASSDITGLCLFCGVSNTAAAADASLSTGASFNLTAGLGVTGKIQVTSNPSVLYPAGSAVTAVIDNGGSGLLSSLIGGIITSSRIILTNNGADVQTLDASSGLAQIDLLGGLLGANQGAIGGIATVAFNGARFEYDAFLSVLSGWTMNGIAVQTGCAAFQSCGLAVSSQTVFRSNGTSGQTGTITIPITTSAPGAIKVGVSGSGFTTVSNQTISLTAGQTSITIPVTFDGTSPVGNRTVTVTEYNFITNAALSPTCTYTVAVVGSFAFDCSSSSATITPTFQRTNTSQTGSITVPISGAVAGQSATVSVTTANGFSGTVTQTLTAGQTTITIPVTFTGATAAGTYPLTITSNQASGSCSVTATVVEPISGINPVGVTSGGNGTTTTGNAAAQIQPTGGISPYTYTAVDCSTGTTTSSTATTSTQTTAFGSVTVNKTTGAYTYTPNGTFGATGDSFCIKVCDATNPATATSCLVSQFNVSLAQSTYTFACPIGALTKTGNFTVGAGSSQAGTVTIPLTGATAGAASFTVSGGGFTSSPTPFTTILTANQASVVISVIYDGTGVAGPHAITVTSPSANTSSTCNTGTVQVLAGFSLGNGTPTAQTTPQNTPLSGNVATLLAPTGGTSPYVYSLVNCSTGAVTTTSTNGGTVTVNSSTGAYTYTPANNFTGNDSFCIKVCDSTTPTASCQTATIPVTVSAVVVNAPTVTSSPNPPAAGQSVTLTATNCAGTITWLNNGVTVSTNNPYTTTATAGSTYTAICTVNGIPSVPSSGITVIAAAPQDYTTTITPNSFGQFTVSSTKTFTVRFTNTGTTTTTLGATGNVQSPFGWSCTGCGAVNIPTGIAAGQSHTVTVSLTANAVASGNLTSTITQGTGDTNSANNSAVYSAVTQ